MSAERGVRAPSTGSESGASHLLQRTLLGRQAEMDKLVGLLGPGGPRVVNVTGTPGVGKSALVRAALGVAGSRFGEVERLDLTGHAPDSLVLTIGRRITQMPHHVSVGPQGDTEWGASLLVLERADALAPLARDLVALARAYDTLTILVESVPELRAPGCATVLVEALEAEPAVALFDRAADALGVPLDEDPATAARVARVCASVGGNPLAIELAAARLPVISLASLDTLLATPGQTLSVLAPTAGTGLGPRSIVTALSASRQASSAQAQTLLDLFGVFAGGFSVEAAEAVSGGVVSPCWDALAELLDLRLVELDRDSGGDRYRLSQLVRGYTSQRLKGSPLARPARARHAAHYSEVARRAAVAVEDADEDTARRAMGEDFAEAFTALRWLTDADPAKALRLAADLGWAAQRRGTGESLSAAIEGLLPRSASADPAALRDALLWLVQLQSWAPQGGDRTEVIRDRLAAALALARELDDPLPLLWALRTRFLAVAALGDVGAAMDACREGMTIASAVGHPRWLGRFEISLSSMHSHLRQYEQAAALGGSGLARAQRSNDRRAVVLGALVLHGLPPHFVEDADVLPSLEGVLATTRELGDIQNETHVLATLAHQAVERGDHRAAASWVLARQEHLGRSDLLHGLTVSVMLTVHVARLAGDNRMAALLHGAVDSQVRTLVPLLAPSHAEQYRQAVDTTQTALGSDHFNAEVARGKHLDRDQTFLEMIAYLSGVMDAPPDPPTAPATRTAGGPTLSARELQVLELLARGWRNKEIAAELHLSAKTVMHHTVSIYRKLGVRSRAEAAITAARRGLVSLE